MSLKVWLPLNGDLTQQGASGVSMINSNATVNTSGKIGSCYYFNASAYLYENTYDWTNFNTSQFSLCCWYKQPSPVASGNSQIICIGTSSGWNNIRIGLLRRTSSGYPMFSVSNGSSAVKYNCTATTFSLDTWNHIACTYDNGAIKIYLNGTLDKTYTTTIVPVLNSSQHLGVGAASNGAEKLTGYLNDVRIYDHCLSAAKVKEISQGLMLHYKLDDITNGIQDSSGYNYNGTINGTLQAVSTSARYNNCIYSANGGSNYIQTPTLNMPTDAITLNIWFKTNSTAPTSDYHMVVDSVGSSTIRQHYEMCVHKTGYFRGGLFVNGSRRADNCTSTTGCNNQWHMLTLSYDGTAVKRYFDGTMEKSTSVAITSGLQPTATLRLLKDGNSSYACINTSLSDFRIYCTALDADAIRQLYEVGAKIDNKNNLYTFELDENGTNKLMKTGVFQDYIVEPYLKLADGSYWKLLLFHYVDNGTNLFTSSNAAYNNGFGLYSRLREIDGYTYNNKYEFYVLQDDIEYRWTQTNAPFTTTSVSGFTAVTGSPGGGICKCSGNTVLAATGSTSNWWRACGCYKIYNNGIPGFNNTVCKKYLALYARIEAPKAQISNGNLYAENFIEA